MVLAIFAIYLHRRSAHAPPTNFKAAEELPPRHLARIYNICLWYQYMNILKMASESEYAGRSGLGYPLIILQFKLEAVETDMEAGYVGGDGKLTAATGA